ncbi:MAG: hypothetical protein D6698_07545, partial [Gammaproteobacteria bacterium]
MMTCVGLKSFGLVLLLFLAISAHAARADSTIAGFEKNRQRLVVELGRLMQHPTSVQKMLIQNLVKRMDRDLMRLQKGGKVSGLDAKTWQEVRPDILDMLKQRNRGREAIDALISLKARLSALSLGKPVERSSSQLPTPDASALQHKRRTDNAETGKSTNVAQKNNTPEIEILQDRLEETVLRDRLINIYQEIDQILEVANQKKKISPLFLLKIKGLVKQFDKTLRDYQKLLPDKVDFKNWEVAKKSINSMSLRDFKNRNVWEKNLRVAMSRWYLVRVMDDLGLVESEFQRKIQANAKAAKEAFQIEQIAVTSEADQQSDEGHIKQQNDVQDVLSRISELSQKLEREVAQYSQSGRDANKREIIRKMNAIEDLVSAVEMETGADIKNSWKHARSEIRALLKRGKSKRRLAGLTVGLSQFLKLLDSGSENKNNKQAAAKAEAKAKAEAEAKAKAEAEAKAKAEAEA